MKNVGASWSVATSFTLVPEAQDHVPPLEVSVLAVQTAAVGGSEIWHDRPSWRDTFSSDYQTGKPQPVPQDLVGVMPTFREFEGTRPIDPLWALAEYVALTSKGWPGGLTEAAERRLVALLTQDVRVPEFGSPPHSWASLSHYLTSGLSGGAVYFAGGDPVFVVLTGISATLILRVALPAADGLGKGLQAGLEHKVRKAFGLPGFGGDSTPDEGPESS